MPPIIEVSDLTKTFAGNVRAVDSIDFAVEEGEIFGFIGLNGAGKSTTIHILTTLLHATSGTARIAGFDVARQSDQVRRAIGVALQEAGLDPYATGREFREFQARLHGLDRRQAMRRAAALLEAVGLTDAAGRRIKTYSGGMQRRLDLAAALVHQPRVLFLDEPTTGLDPASRQAIWEEVRRLNREEGRTVFLTSHYLEEVDRLAHRVAIIDHGRIVAEGSPAELKAAIGNEAVLLTIPVADRVAARLCLSATAGVASLADTDAGLTFVAEDGVRTLARVLRLLEEADIAVNTVSMQRPTLEEVFLRTTVQPSVQPALAAN